MSAAPNRAKPAGHATRNRGGGFRHPVIYAFALGGVIFAGIEIRKLSLGLPSLFPKVGGDALWALAVFLFFCLLAPYSPTRRVAIAASLFCMGIEFSQKCHAFWLEQMRRTLPGRLILGSVFAWEDFSYYALGLMAGILFDAALRGRNACKPGETI